MESYLTYCLAAVIPVLLLLYRVFTKPSYKFPPGPKGWPIFGSIFDISPDRVHQDYTRLSEGYGDVTCFDMVGAKVVMLNSAQAIREAFASEETRDAFAGRPNSFYVKYCDRGPSTAFKDFGDLWRIQRKFMVKTLKVFDDAHHKIESTIREELMTTVKRIQETKGNPFYIKSVIVPSLANILIILITGSRYSFDSPETRSTMEFDEIDARLLESQTINILTWFPFLRHLPFGFGKLYREHQQSLKSYLYHLFEKPKKTFNPSVSRGFIDDLFRLQPDNPWLTDDNIRGIVRETAGAGLGTTRASTLAFFLIILHKPHVMREIQEEIDSVIGGDRSPCVSDRRSMPYTEATTMELLRYVSVAPLGAPHTTTRDVNFREYFLPKGTLVFANQWAAHHDVTVWGDPWEFRPERFLNEDGTLQPADSKTRRNWLAFGVGKRECFGETFARSRLFLFITTLLQHFDFRPCADDPLPSCDPRGYQPGITIHAPKYNIRAFPRQMCRGN